MVPHFGALLWARLWVLCAGSCFILPAGHDYFLSREENKSIPLFYLCLCLRGKSTLKKKKEIEIKRISNSKKYL